MLVIQLLGKSLEDCFKMSGQKLSLKSVCMLATQMISLAQRLHEANFLHRDIKPDNFMMGAQLSNSDSEAVVYLIDFGLAKRWNNRKTGQHIPNKDGK